MFTSLSTLELPSANAYRVEQNKPDYSNFQPISENLHKSNAFNTCSAQTDKKTEKKYAFKYSSVINTLCDVVADIVDTRYR